MHRFLRQRSLSLTSYATVAILVVLSIAALGQVPSEVKAPGGSVTVSINPGVATGGLGSFFDVFVIVDNVKSMVAYNGKLNYDTIVLTATAADAEYATPSGGICATGCEDITPEAINDGLGEVTWEVAMTGFPTGFTGSGGMVKITFRVDADGTSALTPTTALLDSTFTEIPHTDNPGTFTNVPPTADFQWDANQDGTFENGKAAVGSEVTFDGSISTDPKGLGLTYEWDVFDDGSVDGTGVVLNYTFSSAGDSTVKLTVCNAVSLCDPVSKTITVNAPIKLPPTAVIDPTSVKIVVGGSVTFNGSQSFDNSTPAQAIVRYVFTVGTTVQNGSSPTFTFQPSSAGTYSITLVVCNESTLCSTPTMAQAVVNLESHDLQVVTGSVTPNATSTLRGSTVKVDATIKNVGSVAETFQLHLTVTNSTQTVQVEILSLTLGAGLTQTYTLNWPTATFVGTYLVEVQAELASDDNQTNNMGSGGSVFIIVHDLEITQASASPSTITRGAVVSIAAEITNRGNVDETFQLTATATATGATITIPGPTLTLNAGLTQAFTINWDTTGVARGSYSINALAVLSSDMVQSNNQRPGGSIIVQVHDVLLVEAFVSQTTVDPGDSVTVSVTVENRGDFTETITITLSVEGTALTPQQTTLGPGDEKTLNFTWTTAGVDPGTYGYEANLQAVSGDIFTADNVILEPDAVTVRAAPPLIDYRVLPIVLILIGLLSAVLLIRARGRRSRGTSPSP